MPYAWIRGQQTVRVRGCIKGRNVHMAESQATVTGRPHAMCYVFTCIVKVEEIGVRGRDLT